MLRVLADNTHDTLALNNLALITNLLYTGPDFHNLTSQGNQMPPTVRLEQQASGVRRGQIGALTQGEIIPIPRTKNPDFRVFGVKDPTTSPQTRLFLSP